jgi:predicted HTH domain antitoxin
MLTVRFDTSQIEELAADTKALSDRAVALYQSGLLSLNEARQIMGYAEIESMDTPAEAAEDAAEGEAE